MNTINLTINFLNLDYVTEKIEKFNKKALHLKKQPLTLTHNNSYIVTTVNEETKEEEVKELIDIEILQPEELIINGYKIIADIDHTYPDKNFVKPYVTLTPEQENKYQTINCNCEHCKSDRIRNTTYIIQNVETEKYMQVGKSCLNDFVGYNVLKSLSYFDLLQELTFDIIDFNKKAKKETFYKIYEVLAIVKNEIDKHGYKSSNQKYNGQVDTTTGDDVRGIIYSMMSNVDKTKNHLPEATEEQETEFKTTIDYLLNYNTEKETNEEFYNNLKNILKYKYCKSKDIAILSTLFIVCDILKSKEEKENNKQISKHVGNIGDKTQASLRLDRKIYYETQFGSMTINIFKDIDGNVYKWNSANTLDLGKEEYKTVKFTIKGHETYGEEKQTNIIRCKII